MPKETNLEFRVGLFVFLALATLTFFIFSITDSSVFEQGKSLRVVFGFANGLKKNAPVRIAGVDEGIVEDIQLFFDREMSQTKVEIIFKIKNDTRIPADSTIMINQLGLLGEKYLEIIPGTDTKNFFQEGKVLTGKDPVPNEVISERVTEVVNKVDESIAGINRLITDERNIASVSDTLAHLSQVTGNLRDISEDVKSGKGNIGKLFYDERLYDDIQAMTSDLKDNPWKLLYRPKR